MEDDIHTIIAKAIRGADWTIFNENYSKQAAAVVKAVNKAGWAIVPREPDDETVKTGAEEIEIGQHKPSEIARVVYRKMVRFTGL